MTNPKKQTDLEAAQKYLEETYTEASGKYNCLGDTDGNFFIDGYLAGRSAPSVKGLYEAAKNLKWCGNGKGQYCVTDEASATMMTALAAYEKETAE